jgi:deoxyribodipyrimidine photo-lyase
MRTLVWFRGKDLRVSDNVALTEASRDAQVIPLFVAGPELTQGAHRTQFLVDSAEALARNLEALGSGLVVARGAAASVIPDRAKRWHVDRVVAHRRTEPWARDEAKKVEAALSIPLTLVDGETLLPPETVRTDRGTPYAVFTPFSRAFRHHASSIGDVLPAPKRLPPLPPEARRDGQPLPTPSELGIERTTRLPEAGERAARERSKAFFAAGAGRYHETRDRLDVSGTSRLSADLRAGLVSVRSVWQATLTALAGNERAFDAFTNELLWREFAHTLLWDHPELARAPFRAAFAAFPWENDGDLFDAWREGRTGYPVVDASARQLLAEGFVPNRARMISASFLTKHLFVDYRWGERHYYEQLTDGDQANNNAGWQWSAGCGVDAQPYFRVFNPAVQGKKFDPDGAYVRRWVPELARLPARYVHSPASAPESVLRVAGIALGRDYPRPVVDHAGARARFLAIAGELSTATP